MIRPIDMQTLLMQMDKVGKEHAHTRDNVINQQDLEAQKLLKVEDQASHAVNEPEETQTSENKVKTDDQGPRGGAEGNTQKKKDEETTEEEPKKKDTWQDPLLGTHIDISG